MGDLPALPSFVHESASPREGRFIGLGSTPNLDRVQVEFLNEDLGDRTLYDHLKEGFPIVGLRTFTELRNPVGGKVGKVYTSRWEYIRFDFLLPYHRVFGHEDLSKIGHLKSLMESYIGGGRTPPHNRVQVQTSPGGSDHFWMDKEHATPVHNPVKRHSYLNTITRVNPDNADPRFWFCPTELHEWLTSPPSVDQEAIPSVGDLRYIKLPLSASYRGHFNDDASVSCCLDAYMPLQVVSTFDTTLAVRGEDRNMKVETVVLQAVPVNEGSVRGPYADVMVETPGRMENILSGKKGRSCYIQGNLTRFLPIPLPRGCSPSIERVTQAGSLTTGNRYRFHGLYDDTCSPLHLRGIIAEAKPIGDPLTCFVFVNLWQESFKAQDSLAVIYSHVISRMLGMSQTYQPVMKVSNHDSYPPGWQLRVLRFFPDAYDALTPLLDGLNQVLKTSLPGRLKQAVAKASSVEVRDTLSWHVNPDQVHIDQSIIDIMGTGRVRKFRAPDFEVPSTCHKCGRKRIECPQCQIAGRKATVCACPSDTHSIEDHGFICFEEEVSLP